MFLERIGRGLAAGLLGYGRIGLDMLSLSTDGLA